MLKLLKLHVSMVLFGFINYCCICEYVNNNLSFADFLGFKSITNQRCKYCDLPLEKRKERSVSYDCTLYNF